jgi:exopolyphosphatase / guanosine-5'-triphosphate,3'-diphosphate pyrophosphatase
MHKINPRWEWRSFGRCFGGAESRLAKLTPGGVQESDEIYLLSGAGDNVKVRDARMDIKVLREVNADGLEQWTPVMKAGFPLPAADAVKVLESLHLPAPPTSRASFTLDEFLEQFAAPGSAIRAVKVHKRRTRYTVGGCMAELSEVVANGKPTRTIAVESENADGVIRAVRELGLGGYTNTSYPRGLAALIDDEPECYAVIDAGTNSIKFHLGERDREGRWRTVADRAELTRLGERLAQQGVISEAAIERTVAAIAGMVAEAKRHGVRAIAAVGTAGLRSARNGKEVVAAIAKRTGMHIEVISGEEESRLAYLATKAGLGLETGSLVVFDTGGGSTQFTFGHDSSVDERFSVEVGAVGYTERCKLDGVVSPNAVQEAMAAISADLSRIDGRPVPDALVAMGGAVTNITAVKHGLATYDPSVVQGTVLDRAEIDRQIELYRSRDASARRAIVGLQPKRAEVILAGACIVRTVMEKLGKDSLTVSDRGLRHGVLAERFGLRTERDLADGHQVRSDNSGKSTHKKPRTKKPMKTKTNVKNKPAKLAAPNVHTSIFSDQQVAKILKLLKGSSSMELKVVVPVPTHRATIESIGLDPVEAQPRQAYFFDTTEFDLNKAGVVVRARRIQGGRADTVIKLRPVDPSSIDRNLRRSESFKVELDAMPGGFVCSASLKGRCTGQEVLDVTAGKAPLKSLFSKEQRAFYAKHAPRHISMESLITLGPTYLLKAKHNPPNFNRGVVVEMWLYPDGSRILEISTKCLPEEAFQAGVEFRAYLANCGIPLSVTDQTKTKAAMEYFKKKLGSD